MEQELNYGKKLLQAEWEQGHENAAQTLALLESGQLGERAPVVVENLGTALSLLSQVASCAWGCRGGDHDVENLIRRCCNYAFGSVHLALLGLYDEALSLLRGVAEIANLMEFFCIDKAQLQRWKGLPPKDRQKQFSPVRVREAIKAAGKNLAVEEDVYKALCELGVHVTPDSMKTTHQHDGKVHVGGNFSVMGFLLVMNELAINLSPCLLFAGYLTKPSEEKFAELKKQCDDLRTSASSYVRVTNYQELMREMVEKELAGRTEARESQNDGKG